MGNKSWVNSQIAYRIYKLFERHPRLKLLLEFAASAAIIVSLIYFFNTMVLEEFISNVVAFMLSVFIYRLFTNFKKSSEDFFKVSYSDDVLMQYDRERYLHNFHLNGSEVEVFYEKCFTTGKHGETPYKIVIFDEPEKMFQLDTFIKLNYFEIMEAHRGSTYNNCLTIRLDRFELDNTNKILNIYTSRSRFLSHLLTNRAIDYKIRGEITLRELYECGTTLNPLERSMFSNHIGINGLIFLSDGNMLLPKRDSESTISKGQVTAGIAMRLIVDDYTQHLSTDDLIERAIIPNLSHTMMINDEWIKENGESIEIKLLGFGRNLYEGGKPQFYYKILLHSLTSEEYLDINKSFKYSKKELDAYQPVYVCNWKSLQYIDNKLTFKYLLNKEKTSEASEFPEKSLLCNILHLLSAEEIPFSK